MEYRKWNRALKWRRFFIICWPLLCVFFVGIILRDAERTMEERICDSFFAILPLVFFAIGMSMRYRILKESKDASTLTKAVVVSDGLRIQPGKRNFFPEFEFQAADSTYRVKYSAGYSFRIVKEGETVDLYYDPENPSAFFVPAVQKRDRRLAWLLCGIGVVWPLLGLLAPFIRMRLSFLY